MAPFKQWRVVLLKLRFIHQEIDFTPRGEHFSPTHYLTTGRKFNESRPLIQHVIAIVAEKSAKFVTKYGPVKLIVLVGHVSNVSISQPEDVYGR